MERLKAFVKLMRPRHTAQVVGIVAVLSTASHGFSTQTLTAIFSIFFLSMGVFFLDDAHDIKSDQIEHQQRPIPKGLITIRQAFAVGVAFLLLGGLLASMLLLYQFALFLASAAIAIAVVFADLKSVLRASLTALLIWALFPFSAFPDAKTMLFGLIMALPHVGGTIAKDFLHFRGDAVQGLEPPSDWLRYVASTAFFLGGVIVWLPKVLGFVTWLYVPPIFFTFVACMTLGIRMLKGRYEKVYIYGAVGMCSALIAFLLAGI